MRGKWTPAEEALLRKHSKTGPAAANAKAFWAALQLPGRSALAVFYQAQHMHLYANTRRNAEERTCSCGATFLKCVSWGTVKEDTEDLCKPCVRRKYLAEHLHKRTCSRCAATFRGGRRQVICPTCKGQPGFKRRLKK